ncbi:Uncharacterized protein Fot_06255 [Forsythia ovata]|uniref:Uncharacterized protein n=1 Tax=Forsythia ovata TaxID=205694 RepID=A0ABD1WSU3_9LAMI
MEKFEANWNRKSSSGQEQREEEEPSNGMEDLFSGPGFNNIHKGSRMARARRTSLDSLNFPKPHVPPPPPLPARGCDENVTNCKTWDTGIVHLKIQHIVVLPHLCKGADPSSRKYPKDHSFSV